MLIKITADMTQEQQDKWDSLVVDDDYDEDDGWDHEDDYDDDRLSPRDQQINDRLDMGKNEAGEWLGWTI
jgi:hypothetical protein